MVEIEFHNTSTHHAFSMPNPLGFSMAALNEQALVLACERSEDVPRYVYWPINYEVSYHPLAHSYNVSANTWL